MREFGLDETTLTEEEVAKRRQELKTLIKMGKTRGFLTHQEINDHLPEKLVDNEILEAIVSMLNDMGIAVYEQAPDAATLLIAGGGTATATEEEAEEAAEAALSTVDSRVRPHHRPGAHVHARDGHGRAADARRRDRDRQAHRRRPAGHDAGDLRLARRPSPRSWRWPTRSRAGEMTDLRGRRRLRRRRRGRRLRGRGRLRRVRRGRRRRRQRRQQGADQEARGAEGRGAGEVRRRCASHFDKMRKAYEKDGYKSPAYNKAQHAISDELMTIRFTVKTIEKLCDILRSPGRRRAPLRARDPQDRGRQVRHAAGALHQDLPAQRAEPEVGREGNRRRQALQRGAGAQPAGRCRNCSRS